LAAKLASNTAILVSMKTKAASMAARVASLAALFTAKEGAGLSPAPNVLYRQ
jgi:hypothetical protein